MKSVYLAGPISGLNFDGASEWRDAAIAKLLEHNIDGYSPLRCKAFLKDIEKLSCHGRDYESRHVFSSSRGIMTRDRFDATRCDVLLVNLVGAKAVSIGTVMEIAWADLKRTPVVCAMEEGNVHEHIMVNEAIGFRVPTLEEAINVTIGILGKHRGEPLCN